MIYGETTYDDVPVLNTRWPHDRGVYEVIGTTEGGREVHAFVLDDCAGDAIDSVLAWCDEEGSDDAGLRVLSVRGELRASILAACTRFNAEGE